MSNAAPTIAPELGKRYVTRDGRVTGPMRKSFYADRRYPFMAAMDIIDRFDLRAWTAEGRYNPSSNSSHPLDLVAEYAPIAEPPPSSSFQSELTALINRHSIEGGSDTPDYILAEFLRQCLDAFDMATRQRDEHKS